MSGREELSDWLSGIHLSLNEAQWSQLETYLAGLREHNARVNLTAEAEGLWWTRHIADGLAALAGLKRLLPHAPSLLDLGAGAGFVGISLKIAWPESSITLMESSYRKFQFLNWVSARLGLKGLKVLWRRAGAEARGAQPLFDSVILRAVAPLPEALKTAAPLARPDGGVVLAYQSEPPGPEVLERALAESGCSLRESSAYRLPRETRTRRLLFFRRNR